MEIIWSYKVWKLIAMSQSFFVEENQAFTQKSGGKWEIKKTIKSFVAKPNNKTDFSRWQISGFVQNVKQKFI